MFHPLVAVLMHLMTILIVPSGKISSDHPARDGVI
jgi:hypothetical protein